MYSIVFKNNSTNAGNICVFQQDPNMGVPNVMSLAWFSKFTNPSTNAQFSWTVDYSFVWAETGEVVPGVIFSAGQVTAASLSDTNQITLSYNGGYYFQNQGKGAASGNLYIKQDNTIPLKQAAIGIGMSGKGVYAVQAQPNMNLTFTPHPQYWVVFGNYSQGEVLDIGSLSNSEAVKFPPGVSSMSVTLNEDNTWTIMPLSQANLSLAKK